MIIPFYILTSNEFHFLYIIAKFILKRKKPDRVSTVTQRVRLSRVSLASYANADSCPPAPLPIQSSNMPGKAADDGSNT